jgi:tRNA dimethylallyltransferase
LSTPAKAGKGADKASREVVSKQISVERCCLLSLTRANNTKSYDGKSRKNPVKAETKAIGKKVERNYSAKAMAMTPPKQDQKEYIETPRELESLIEDLLQKPNPLLVILGPTASGKTAFSLHIAKKYHGEILSTDSRQIYKQLAISTEKILPQDQQGVPHHLIDFVEPDQVYTAAQYKEDAAKIISEITARGNLPMLVGGTGLYISSIIHNYEIPKIPPQKELREKLQKEAEEHGIDFLYQKLKAIDPRTAETIHPNNLRYIIRALEMNEVTHQNKVDKKSQSPYSTLIIGIDWPREKLYKRINSRVDSQIARGLLEEIQSVLKKGYAPDLPSMTSIGCKELMPYFSGKMTLDEAKEIIQGNTRKYARRQITWFRREKNIHWIHGEKIRNFL